MRGGEQGWRFLLPPQCQYVGDYLVNKRVASLHFRVEGQILTVVCAYGPNTSSPFLESLEGVLESAPLWDSFVLLGDFNAEVGRNSETWRGVVGKNCPPYLNPRVVLLLDFCACHGLSIMNTMVRSTLQKCPHLHLAPGHLRLQYDD